MNTTTLERPPRLSSLKEAYAALYRRGEAHDSPERSRVELIARMSAFLTGSNVAQLRVLDMGSGAQMLERQLLRLASNRGQDKLRERLASSVLVSMDLAPIRPKQLKAPAVPHVRTDHAALPFGDGSFDLVVSNLSIDMLRVDSSAFTCALAGVQRVLKPGGVFLANYHTASLYDANSERFAESSKLRARWPHQAAFYDGSDNPFYGAASEIAGDFYAAGLVSDAVRYVEHRNETWWEVAAMNVT